MEPKPILLWNCTHFRHPTDEQLRHVDIHFLATKIICSLSTLNWIWCRYIKIPGRGEQFIEWPCTKSVVDPVAGSRGSWSLKKHQSEQEFDLKNLRTEWIKTGIIIPDWSYVHQKIMRNGQKRVVINRLNNQYRFRPLWWKIPGSAHENYVCLCKIYIETLLIQMPKHLYYRDMLFVL